MKKLAKVVVAQYNSVIPEVVEALARKNKYDLQHVQGGEAVFKALELSPLPDLLVMESSLEDPPAHEVCQRLKSHPQFNLIPVILLVNQQKESDHDLLIRAGFDEILISPINSDLFQIRIETLLRIRKLPDELEDSESILFTLARILEAKDPTTLGHADRVAHFAVDLGRSMGLKESELITLRKGGMLHDIGKVAIPDPILNKPGKYTPEEFEVMKKHPVLGCDICEKLNSVKDALPLIKHHHEKLDGRGYPSGIKGDEIPPLVRIVTIVDIFDALRSRRPYKDAFSIDKTFQIMWEEAEKGWWDKEILGLWEKQARKKQF